MNQNILFFVAVILGMVHIVLRSDYYNPFITISRTKKWSFSKTMGIVLLCGIGHVIGSIVLSAVAVVPAVVASRLNYFVPMRDSIAAYFLILFGLFYVFYGIRSAYRSKPHKHLHLNPDGTYFTHTHVHKKENTQFDKIAEKKNLTIWSLIITFAFIPCESLMAILVYPAVKKYYMLVLVAIAFFSVISIVTMLIMTGLVMQKGRYIRFKRIGIFYHLILGSIILFYGISIKFLGV